MAERRRRTARDAEADAVDDETERGEAETDEADPDEADLDEAETDEVDPDEAELDEADPDEADPDEAESDEPEADQPERARSRRGRPEHKGPKHNGAGHDGVGHDGAGNGERRLSAAAAGRAGLEQIIELTGKHPESVTGVRRSDEGWVVTVEVIEDRRIPSSTDILSTYETEIDGHGELLSYRRVRRYSRGHGDDGDS